EAEPETKDVRAAARGLGFELHVLNASSEREIDAAFATLIQLRAGALLTGSNPFLFSRGAQIAALAIRHAVPAIFVSRETVVAGDVRLGRKRGGGRACQLRHQYPGCLSPSRHLCRPHS